MFKCSTPERQGAVLKLFNIVVQSGCFPDIWCEGLIRLDSSWHEVLYGLLKLKTNKIYLSPREKVSVRVAF